MNSITINGFTWHGPICDLDGRETWRLDSAQRRAVEGFWYLKNFSGTLVSGWRLVGDSKTGPASDDLIGCAHAASIQLRLHALKQRADLQARLNRLEELLESTQQ